MMIFQALNLIEDNTMYYIDLPWYVQIIWIIGLLIVMLPIAVTLSAIGTIFFQEVQRIRREKFNLGFENEDVTSQLGITMADGGDKLQTKPESQ